MFWVFFWIFSFLLLSIPVIKIFAVIIESKSEGVRRNFEEKNLPKIVEEMWQTISDICRTHAKTLSRKKQQLSYADDYGVEVNDRWENEKESFFQKLIVRNDVFSQSLQQFSILLDPEKYAGVIDALRVYTFNEIEGCIEPIDVDFQEVESMSGIDFELYVENILKIHGWSVTRTSVTGDQGVDLMAEKNRVKLAIQCKRYNSPVGNASVQEVFSGKKFYDADFAAVISNQSYTSSARQLASNTNVLLLHFSEIKYIDNMLTKALI